MSGGQSFLLSLLVTLSAVAWAVIRKYRIERRERDRRVADLRRQREALPPPEIALPGWIRHESVPPDKRVHPDAWRHLVEAIASDDIPDFDVPFQPNPKGDDR